MNRVYYSFEESQMVISDAWDLAMNHLKETLGDQFTLGAVSGDLLSDFYDKIEQATDFMMECPNCGTIDLEGNFSYSVFYQDTVCWDCSSHDETHDE